MNNLYNIYSRKKFYVMIIKVPKKRRRHTFMIHFRKKDSKELIKQLAKIHGCSVKEVREEMQCAIEEARNNDDPDKQAEFQRLFGDRTPSPEEFICKISKSLKF